METLGACVYGKYDPWCEDDANASREFTRHLLLGESVFLEDAHPHEGRSGTVAYVYRARDELFVNLELVRRDHAAPLDNPHRYKDLFDQSRSEAVPFRGGVGG